MRALSDRGFWRRLGALHLRLPVLPITLGLVLASAAAWRATKLELRPQLSELLPQNKPSVVELHKVLARTRGVSNVFVVLEGQDTALLRRFGDELAARLMALGEPWVGSAESGLQQARAFLGPRAGLFADRAKLIELRDELDRAKRQGFAAAIGADLDDAPDAVTAERLQAMLGRQGQAAAHYPDGYYQSSDGHALVVVARPNVLADDLGPAREALDRIQAVVKATHDQPAYRQVRVSYAGDLVTGMAEYSAIRTDLVQVGALGVGMVLAIVLVFYMRLRSLLLLGITVAAGSALTFGATELVVGVLNTATGFLFSIVAGNGINCGIILQSRYLEERERGAGIDEAMQTAIATTWRPTLSAVVAAAAAYGALGATDFRAFHHFAFIGASGMLLCWVATYLMLPPLLVVSDRLWPVQNDTRVARFFASIRARSSRFDAPFTWLVPRAPRALTIAGTVLGLAGAVITARYVQQDPLEYNLRNIENDRTETGEIYRASALAQSIVGANTAGAMLVMTDHLDQVAPLQTALRAKRDAAPPEEKPFEEVHSILDFVPADQASKLPLIADIRDKLLRARDLGGIADEEWQRIEPYLPPPGLRPFTMADLPDAVKRPFTEKDGTVGRILFIEPTSGQADNDLHYLLRWAASFRETQLPGGTVIHGSGRAVIYADLVSAVNDNMPRALGLALLLTLFTVWVAFRGFADGVPVMAALLVGLLWMGAAMALLGARIHFVNFVALPITLGIGVDYAVNVMSRYRDAGGGTKGVSAALRGTGGPVILCSLTTAFGYLALLLSRNQAVRSLGLVAVLGEITCLLAALVILPGALQWSARNAVRPSPTAVRQDERPVESDQRRHG